MIVGLFPLLLLALVGVAIYSAVRAAQRHHTTVTPGVSPSPAAPSRGLPSHAAPRDTVLPARRTGLDADLARWVAAGLLSREQASAIVAHEQSTVSAPAVGPTAAEVPARRRRVPPVAEALGYLGGMLAMIGLVLVMSRYWRDMPTAGRLALSGAGAVALLIGGLLVHERADPALARLRWFLWLIATAATGLFAGILARDVLDVGRAQGVAISVSAAVAVLSAALWRWRERPLQQFTCLGGLTVLAGTVVAQIANAGAAGLAVWAVGFILVVAALRELTPLPALTQTIGSAAAGIGALVAAAAWQGPALVFCVATGLLLLSIAVLPGLAPSTSSIVVAAVVGGVVMLQATPATLVYFAHDAGGVTGIVTWAMGAMLIYAGGRRLLRVPMLAEIFGGLALIGGAALTGVQWSGLAPLFGIATALGLVGLGMLPGRVIMSVLGSLGLLINVPWAIGRFFPGEGRAPLLIMVSGALIIAVAVLLTRMGGRFRSELHGTRRGGPRHGAPPSGIAPMHS